MLLRRARRGARGKAQAKMVMKPNWMTISRYLHRYIYTLSIYIYIDFEVLIEDEGGVGGGQLQVVHMLRLPLPSSGPAPVVELKTGLCNISKCPEKARNRAFSFLVDPYFQKIPEV